MRSEASICFRFPQHQARSCLGPSRRAWQHSRTDYRRAIEQIVRLGRQATICTIYNDALPADETRLARIGLMMFNDVILRSAFDERLDVIDLRPICQKTTTRIRLNLQGRAA